MSALRNCMVAAVFSLLVLNMLSCPVSAFGTNGDCCLKYSMKAMPFQLISGYVLQRSNEICDIDAIIFYTVRGRAVCANPGRKWVKRALEVLSKRLEKMSQENGPAS
uniref:C-C motif chemokine 20-like n=1 Tax=Pristiophorus japonicus TaxID=55135 RepID=UPI00398F25DF